MLEKTEKFTLPLAGATFRTKRLARRMIAEKLESEDISCTLILEPENEFDDKAIKVVLNVFLEDLHIGYIGRPTNIPLFELIEREKAILSSSLTSLDIDSGTGTILVTITKFDD